jgi:RimJ/RimL family protein N-acetyltransferase
MTPKDFAASRARVARNAAQWRKRRPPRLDFCVTRREDGAFLGLINICWPHPGVASLGYSFHPRHWGRGYASEAARRVVVLAFDELGAHRVQATCWIKNPRSAAVLKNAGLKKEGLLRGFLKRGTVVRDEFIFGLARAGR